MGKKKRKKKINEHWKGEKEIIKQRVQTNYSTPAPRNGAASTAIGIGLSSGLAIVIGCTASRARHRVPPQSAVADVLASGQNTAVDFWIKFELLSTETLRYGALTGGLVRNPCKTVVDPEAGLDGGWGAAEDNKHGGADQEEGRRIESGHCHARKSSYCLSLRLFVCLLLGIDGFLSSGSGSGESSVGCASSSFWSSLSKKKKEKQSNKKEANKANRVAWRSYLAAGQSSPAHFTFFLLHTIHSPSLGLTPVAILSIPTCFICSKEECWPLPCQRRPPCSCS